MNNKSFIMMNVTELYFIKKTSKGYPDLTLDLKEKSINSYIIHFKIYLFLQIKNVIMCGNHYHR